MLDDFYFFFIILFCISGIITFIDFPNILIDGNLYFDISSCQLSLNLNDKVTYLGFKNETDNIVITRIIQNHGIVWESWADDNVEEASFKIIDHVIVAEVESREKRLVYLKENDLKFSLDDVEGTMVPIAGDWLELNCSVQLDDDKPYNITGSQVNYPIQNRLNIRSLQHSLYHRAKKN